MSVLGRFCNQLGQMLDLGDIVRHKNEIHGINEVDEEMHVERDSCILEKLQLRTGLEFRKQEEGIFVYRIHPAFEVVAEPFSCLSTKTILHLRPEVVQQRIGFHFGTFTSVKMFISIAE